MKRVFFALCVLASLAATAQAEIVITEWMYGGTNGEYVEFTNVGASAVNMTGWSFDDDSRTAGTADLSGFGSVAAGESVILTEAVAADFRTAWGLSAAIKIVGENATNLGRNDEINLFDASGTLVDRLTFGDQNIAGTIRTQYISGNPGSTAELGANNVAGWVLSSVGDTFGSFASAGADVGNPGLYIVPEPSALAMLVVGGFGWSAFIRRSR